MLPNDGHELVGFLSALERPMDAQQMPFRETGSCESGWSSPSPRHFDGNGISPVPFNPHSPVVSASVLSAAKVNKACGRHVQRRPQFIHTLPISNQRTCFHPCPARRLPSMWAERVEERVDVEGITQIYKRKVLGHLLRQLLKRKLQSSMHMAEFRGKNCKHRTNEPKQISLHERR